MRLSDIGFFASGARWLAALPAGMLSAGRKLPVDVVPHTPEQDREEIIARSNWLARKVITAPENLLREIPGMLGKNFGGQWAIYSCSFYCAALANIVRIYPEQKSLCLERMEALIGIVNTKELRAYDTMNFHEDAMASLDGPKSHMTYLSILAWMITMYRLSGGNDRFDAILHACCEALHRRMTKRNDLSLPSFSNGIVFLPDMLVTIVALHNYSLLFDGRYSDTVERWIDRAKHEWIDPNTGLLLAKRCVRKPGANVRGSYAALSCYYLSLVDEGFAREQYAIMKKHLWLETEFRGVPVNGIREYRTHAPSLSFDPDAGPIVCGLSASGTAWALGCAARFGDDRTRESILRMAELAGSTVRSKDTCHYRLGEVALVGEAVLLAMRTNI